MKKKLVGSIICMLLIITTFLPVTGIIKNETEYCSVTVDDEWPMFLHDLQNTGYSTSNAPSTNTMKWVYKTNFVVPSSPAIVNGKVYIGSEDETFYCLDADTGQNLWSKSIPRGVSVSSPAVVDGKVYQGITGDYVYCWDADTGREIWKYQKNYGSSRSPAVVDGKVYISKSRGQTGHNGWLYCLDADTGDELWKYDMGWFELSSPAVYDGKVYLGSEDTKMYCFDAENGSKLWEYQTYMKVIKLIFCEPTLFNGSVYCGGWYTTRLDAETGEEIWSYEVGTSSSPAIAYDRIYFVGIDGYVYCLNADTGAEIWNCSEDTTNAFSPVVADWKIYVVIRTGELICLDADTGEKLWSYQLFPTMDGHGTHLPEVHNAPTVAEGRIYIGGDTSNNIYCFEDPSKPPTDPTIDGPTLGIPNRLYRYTIQATDPEGGNVYYYVDWGDGNNSGWLGPYSSGKEITVSHIWTKAGAYILRAKAKDTYGVKSHYSRLDIGISNPPGAPTIDGPHSGKKGTKYEYIFNSVDPDGDDVKYYIKWGDGESDTTDFSPSGTDVKVNHTWSKRGTYTIKAQAKDIYGVKGNWSEFEVTMPKSQNVYHGWLERFPLLQKVLDVLRLNNR